MVKKHKVDLTAAERTELEEFTTRGRRAADQITRARILLKADCNRPSREWLGEEIASASDVSTITVERMRRRFAELGLPACLKRQLITPLAIASHWLLHQVFVSVWCFFAAHTAFDDLTSSPDASAREVLNCKHLFSIS